MDALPFASVDALFLARPGQSTDIQRSEARILACLETHPLLT